MKKRILSLLLALVLVMQFGIVAFAEESNRETSADYYSEQETKTGKEALSVIDIETFKKKTDMKLYPQPNRQYMLSTL